ncbi:hypothetical protein TNCV_4684771 [Trichonephila clavipes]|nr:hypothetical protein TNCV_4684771 [Trichonephila clavipes]
MQRCLCGKEDQILGGLTNWKALAKYRMARNGILRPGPIWGYCISEEEFVVWAVAQTGIFQRGQVENPPFSNNVPIHRPIYSFDFVGFRKINSKRLIIEQI